MPTKQNIWLDALLVYLAALAFFCIGLGARPYLTPSEARYIEIPRQMLATHDWVTPRIDGVPYFEKPPLFYWMQAMSEWVLGMGEFAGRIAVAKMDALLAALTYATARMLYGRSAGLLAALVFSTSLLGYGMSRVAQLDMPVSLFISAALAAFLAAQMPQNAQRKTWFYLAMYAASALAVMSKGLIGIVIPGLVIAAWIAATRQWRILKEARLFLGLLLFLLIAAPWHVLMAREHPDFLNFYFIHEHFDRYTSDDHHRNAPVWFFLMVIAAGLLPWTGLLPRALKRSERKDPTTLFLLLWIALPLLFFSASHSKLVPYIFPVFAPLCILIARPLSDIWDNVLPAKILRAPILFAVLIFGALLCAVQIAPTLPGKLGAKLAGLAQIPSYALLPLAIALLLLAGAYIAKRNARTLIALLALCGATMGLTVNYIAGNFDTGSIKPLVLSLKDKLKPEDTVVAYESYWQDLPVYLERNVIIAGYRGELTFGAEHYPEAARWMIDADQFKALCADTKPLYVFTRKGATLPQGCTLHSAGEYGNTVLLEK